jgi:hypothetical protein
MALTRPRAYQIYDIDYKQATRVVAVTNTTLAAGAPSVVDGVSLALNDRILVTGQNTASQNGIYYVSILGTGSNGTWTRSTDTDATGELLAGTVVMVTEGVIYADTQWKLTTNDPITIGSTALTFVQNYSANSITAGTSNVVVTSNANVTISAAGTANVLTISSTGTITTGTASVSGNITGGNLLTSGLISTTGAINSDANIVAGTNTKAAPALFYTNSANTQYGALLMQKAGAERWLIGSDNSTGNGNVVIRFNATTNYLTVTEAGAVIVGGNITGGNLLTAGIMSSTGNAIYGNILTAGLISATSTITSAANITGGNILTAGLFSSTGNHYGSNIIGSKTVSAVDNMAINSSGSEGGQLILGWVGINNITSQANSTWNIDVDSSNTLRAFYQNAAGATSILWQANSTSNIVSFPSTAGISAVGNVTGNYFIGNGSQLTGITVSAGAAITNGTSNVTVGASSNTTVGVAGTTVATFASTGIYTPGVVSATGNLYGNYILGNGASLTGVITSVANINSGTSNVTVVSSGGNITVGVGGTSNVAVFATTGEYVTGVVSVSGNIIGGNLLTAGLISATGNVTGGNILTAGLISATGNITAGNISATNHTGTTASVTGNVIGGNVITAGLISATGNITAGNISATNHTGTTVSVTGTVTGSSFTGAGTGLTGTAASLTVGAATSATTAGTVTTAAQPNITSVGSSLTTTGALTVNSSNGVTAIINGGTTGTGNIGSSTTTFNTVFAKATTAQYADLAEMYVADQNYPPGTVVVFGGENEITISANSHDPGVAGIISTDPAYLMNNAQSGTHVLPVALTGRVPCRVVGTIRKGDRLVASGLYPGVATGLNKESYEPGCIIGKALVDYQSTDVGIIEVAVGRF